MNNIENQIDDAAAQFATSYAGGHVSYEQAHANFIDECNTIVTDEHSEFGYDYFCERWDEISQDAIEQWEEHQEYIADMQDY